VTVRTTAWPHPWGRLRRARPHGYLRGSLRPARPNVPSVATHRHPSPRGGPQRGTSGPTPPGMCMSSRADGSMLSGGQAMMRFFPTWEVDCRGVPSPVYQTMMKVRRILRVQGIEQRDLTQRLSKGSSGLAQEVRTYQTCEALSLEELSWNGSYCNTLGVWLS
jgi:hypothetical protein